MLLCPSCGSTEHFQAEDGTYVCTSRVVIGKTAPEPQAPAGIPIFGDCMRRFTAVESEYVEAQVDAAALRAHEKDRVLAAREPSALDLDGHVSLERSLSDHESYERSEFLMAGKGQLALGLQDPLEGIVEPSTPPVARAQVQILEILKQAVAKSTQVVIASTPDVPKKRGLFRSRISGSAPTTVRGWVFPVRYSSRDPRPMYTDVHGILVTAGGRVFLRLWHRSGHSAKRQVKICDLAEPFLCTSGGGSGTALEPMLRTGDFERDLVTISRNLTRAIAAFLVDPAAHKRRVGYTELDGHWLDPCAARNSEAEHFATDVRDTYLDKLSNWPTILEQLPPRLEFDERDPSQI